MKPKTIWWVISGVLMFIVLRTFANSFMSSIVLLVATLIALPPFHEWLNKKHKIKIALWIRIIAILFLFIVAMNLSPEEINPEDNQENKVNQVVPNTEDTEQSQETIQEPDETTQLDYYLVTRVIDGDTIEIEGGERVRLTCIDTPETNEEYYKKAKDYLADLILDKEVKLVKDVSETGKYGRLIRYVYTKDGDFVNELIVLAGWAKAYPYEPDTKLCPQIIIAESNAKDRKVGMWEEKIEDETQDESQDSDYDCNSNVYNCADFSSHAQAQAVFEYCGGVDNDVHKLDRDEDGLACESLP